MKKSTLFLIMLGFLLTANAQHVFDPIVGPTNVVSGTPVTINLNDAANSAAVPASSTGTYGSYTVTADWSAGGGNPWSSEAEITLSTTGGGTPINTATDGSGTNGDDTFLTFEGDFVSLYDPQVDGALDLELRQSFGGSNANWSNIVVTLIESPSCIEPSGMTSSNATTTSVDLNWTTGETETLWNIEYNGGADFTPGNGEEEGSVSPDTTPTTSLSGLTPFTTYFVYYQADCGVDGGSEWVGPFNFITGYCESIPTSNDGNGIAQAQLSSEVFTSGGDITFEDFTAPTVDLPATSIAGFIINFETGFTYNVYVWIDINNDLVYDNDTELVFSGVSAAANPTTFDASFLVPNAPLGNYNMRMVSADFLPSPNPCYSGSFGVTADFTINITAPPSCAQPSDLTVDNITATTADLSWTEQGTASTYNLEIVPSGTAPTGVPTVTGVSNPYTATGLDAVTEYDFYVQAVCGTEQSVFTGPVGFETLCAVFTPDYIENFTTIPADCWEEADNGDVTTGPLDIGAGGWTADGFQNNGTTGAYKINLWNAGATAASDWLLSPRFDLTGGPFQVEFDFGIMEFVSSTETGTLGSDDTVQLVISADNGATWSELLTFDSTTVVPISGITPVADLTAFSGQIVQFGIIASEGTVDDPEDNDVFVDNFRVRNIPTCPEPIELAANNLSLTSTELSWTEAGTSSVYNVQYGPTGFTLGTGTIETDVTNPFILTGLDSDTSYEFYVQAICGPTDLSSFSGPFEFFTGYCESIPSSNDGQGVTNVSIGVTDFPSLGDVTYENQTSPVVNVFQGIDTQVAITFATGFTYDTNIWIDFNDNLVFEESELVFQGTSTSDNPTTLDATFTMPATAPLGEHRMRIGTADFGQATPNPCFNGSFGVTLDFTVNIEELTCTLPEADFEISLDCDNDQYSIIANVTDLGDATSLLISNSFNGLTEQANAIGEYVIGPFNFGPDNIRIFVTNEQDNNCVISSEFFRVVACPPANDNPCEATVAFVNDNILCEQSTPGTLTAATDSGVDAGSCGGNPDDDVWFQFVAQSEFQLVSIANFPEFENIDHAIYSGTCDNLVELTCNDFEYSTVTPSLTIGETYYVRVFSGGSAPETIDFDLCITPYVAPINIACDVAANFCSGNEASDILYSYNTVGVLPGAGTIDCLFTTPNPTYSVLEIGTSGDILIEMVQNTAFDGNDNPIGDELDVDFLLWGPYGPDDNLCELPGIVDCSYSAAPVENVTLLGAQEGEIYLLLITNFARDGGVIQVRQTNTDDDGSGSTIADIEAEIVSDEVLFQDTDGDPSTPVEASVCGFDSVTVQTDSPFADSFIWTRNGQTLTGETDASLTITESGTYQVQAFDDQCGSDALSQIVVVNLYQDPGGLEPQTLTVCDDASADGAEDFDLAAFSSTLGFSEDFTISYYTSTADANQAINAVTSPYTSSGETLIMRIEDVNAAANGFLGCRSISELTLTVNERPAVNQPEDFIVCDDIDGSVDGFTDFDLASISSEVTTDTDLTVTYHTSLEDANNAVGALASPYSSDGQTIFVRAESATSGCYETTSFNIGVNIVPLATFDTETYSFEVCPNATAPVEIGLIPTNFEENQVTVRWFLDGDVIPGASGLILSSVLLAGDYSAEITFIESGCSSGLITETVMELESCVIPQGISPNNDGANDVFDLSSFEVTKLEIFNRNGTLVYSKANYTNEWFGQTNDGDELPVGTYFYTMEYEGGTKQRSAWVYINR